MPNQSELVRIEPQAMEQHRASDDPQALIALAIEKGLDLKELVAMRREWRAEKAKEAFDAAMAAFQSECPVIYKTKGVPTKSGDIAFKYCPFEDVIEQVKPLLQKHGFSYKLGTDVESKDGWVIATCKVTHSGGHSEESEAKFPLGAGTSIMSATQIYAAALSFASRRVFQNSFGVICSGEDMDGRLPKKQKGPSTTENRKELARHLWEILKPVRGSEANWIKANQWMKSKGILGANSEAPNLTEQEFAEAAEKASIALEVG